MFGKEVYKFFFNDGPMPEILYGRSFKDPDFDFPFFFMSDYQNLPSFTTVENNFWLSHYQPGVRGQRDRDGEYWYFRIKKEIVALREFVNTGKG